MKVHSLIVILLFHTLLFAKPGDIDTSFGASFGANGKVTTDILNGYLDEASSIAIQGDGKIVAAGRSYDNENAFALVRYNRDGTLDMSFDTDGIVTTKIENNAANSVAIQSDGKIVAAGHNWDNGSNYDFALVRYSSDGSLDTGFGANGKVITAIGAYSEAINIAIQNDGKIIAAGYSYNGSNYDFALVRYSSDGSLDAGFGANGKVTTAIGSAGDEAKGVAIQDDGKIVAAGFSDSDMSDYDFAVVRYEGDSAPLAPIYYLLQ
jgi:uncharacterized delta-60 repeat protein